MGRDDPRRDAAAQPVGIAHRNHPIAFMRIVGIAESDIGQAVAGIDLHQRQIGLGIAADHLGLVFVAVRQGDGDFAGAVHHMIVGDDIARRIDDEARSRGALLGHAAAIAAARAETVPEEIAEGCGQIGHLLQLLCLLAVVRPRNRGDLHHRWLDPRHQLGEPGLGIGRRHGERRGFQGSRGNRIADAARAERGADQQRGQRGFAGTEFGERRICHGEPLRNVYRRVIAA